MKEMWVSQNRSCFCANDHGERWSQNHKRLVRRSTELQPLPGPTVRASNADLLSDLPQKYAIFLPNEVVDRGRYRGQRPISDTAEHYSQPPRPSDPPCTCCA